MKDPFKRNYYPFNYLGLIGVDETKAVIRIQDPHLRHLCGYVEFNKGDVPKEWWGNYNVDGLQYLNIHGGLTFAEVVNADKFHKGKAIFGFDCAHAGDEEREELKDSHFVGELATQMELQIKMYLKAIHKWRKAGRKKRIKILETIRESGTIKEEVGFGALLDMLSGGRQAKQKK